MRNAETIAGQARSGELHIASFVVQHRPEASAAIEAGIARLSGLERAGGDATRCIVLCESFDPRALMAGIEALQAMPGVINVSLVYHHAEPGTELDMPIPVPEGAMP